MGICSVGSGSRVLGDCGKCKIGGNLNRCSGRFSSLLHAFSKSRAVVWSRLKGGLEATRARAAPAVAGVR